MVLSGQKILWTQPKNEFSCKEYLSNASKSSASFFGSLKKSFREIKFSFSSKTFTNLAGFPAKIEFGGTSFVTTAPAPIILFSPIVTPLQTIALSPIHTLSLRITGLVFPTGSVVTKDVPPNSIFAGNPAKLVKVLDENENFISRKDFFNDPKKLAEDFDALDKYSLQENSFLGWVQSIFWPDNTN